GQGQLGGHQAVAGQPADIQRVAVDFCQNGLGGEGSSCLQIDFRGIQQQVVALRGGQARGIGHFAVRQLDSGFGCRVCSRLGFHPRGVAADQQQGQQAAGHNQNQFIQAENDDRQTRGPLYRGYTNRQSRRYGTPRPGSSPAS